MNDAEKQLLGLTTFVQLEKHARSADSITRLQFIIANETFNLIKYKQAIVWSKRHDGKLRLVTMSGVSQFDANAPYTQWLSRLLSNLSKNLDSKPVQIVKADAPQASQSDWDEYVEGSLLLCPLMATDDSQVGGVIFARAGAWSEAEIDLLNMLLEAYAHAWSSLLPRNTRYKKSGFLYALRQKGVKQILLVALIASMFIPVRQSVLATASIVPLKPKAITSPLEGVVEEVLVKPNQPVEPGVTLFKIDDTRLKSQVEIAAQAFEVAKAEHFRAVQQSFGNVEAKADVALLKARMDQKASEIDYFNRLLEKTTVISPEAGVVIFSNASEWVGKPVVLGEKVMELASTDQVQVEMWLQVDDAINLQQGSEVQLFLNTDPVNPIKATLVQTSYQAEINDNNILAFRLVAEVSDAAKSIPRLGLQGTAKLFGDSVPLVYYLLRRPAATLRQWTGL